MKKKKKREAIEIIERNWADFPPELFPFILKRLSDISDFIRFRAVCKSWRFSSSVSDLSPQFPWIFWESNGSNMEFYSIAINKLYKIHVSCFSDDESLFGPVSGYLLTGKLGNATDNLSLLNPLNKSKVSLPVLHDCADPYWFPNNISWFNPLSFQIDDYMLFSEYKVSVRCKPDVDLMWDNDIFPRNKCRYRYYFLKGLLFKVDDQTWITKVMDIGTRRELFVIPPPEYEEMYNMYYAGPYLIESCGEILAVCFNESYEKTEYKFYIHRLELDNEKGNSCWVNISSIGDRILFFDFHVDAGRGFCLKANDFDFAGFRGNCIYFINKFTVYHSNNVHVISMYDIENGETVLIDTPFDIKNNITWFIPTLNHIQTL